MEQPKKVSIVICCIDYRFWPQALPMLEEKYGEFDLIEIAGSCKNLTSPLEEEDKTALLENIGISIKLHGAEKIILANHIDCGAYGGSENFKSKEEEIAFHRSELVNAKKVVNEKYPQLAVETELFIKDNDKVKII